MSDDLTKRRPQDSSKINVNEPWERSYWSKELGVTPSELETLVDKYGPGAATIRSKIKK